MEQPLESTEPSELVDEFRQLGRSVAAGADAALVGAPGEDGAAGAVFVFTPAADETWAEGQRLEAPDGKPGDEFGWSVALQGDTALVGARGAGAAYAFARRDDGRWQLITRLTMDDDTRRSTLGWSVALAECIAAIGSPFVFASGASTPEAGFVDVYDTCTAPTWTRLVRITDPEPAQDRLFGSALAISQARLLVGSPSAAAASSIVYAYVRTAGGFDLEQEILPPGSPQSLFGSAIQLREELAVIGAPIEDSDPAASRSGAAYVLVHGDGGWTVQQKLQPQIGQQPELAPGFSPWSRYGEAIALDENRLAIAAPNLGSQIDRLPGYVYVYERAGTQLRHVSTLIGHEPANAFGSSVAIAGNRLVVGEPSRQAVIDEAPVAGSLGAAWIYDAERLGELARGSSP